MIKKIIHIFKTCIIFFIFYTYLLKVYKIYVILYIGAANQNEVKKMLPYNDVNLNTEKIGRENIYKNIRLIKLLAK